MSWVRVPPEQLFFLFCEKRVVQVSCLALCIYIHVGSKSFHEALIQCSGRFKGGIGYTYHLPHHHCCFELTTLNNHYDVIELSFACMHTRILHRFDERVTCPVFTENNVQFLALRSEAIRSTSLLPSLACLVRVRRTVGHCDS